MVSISQNGINGFPSQFILFEVKEGVDIFRNEFNLSILIHDKQKPIQGFQEKGTKYFIRDDGGLRGRDLRGLEVICVCRVNSW